MLKALDKYFVMGTPNCQRDPLTILEEALEAGVTIFQLREKGDGALTGDAYVQFAKACQALCQRYDVPFLINDDVALAQALHADGVHIGQDDGDAAHVRQLLPNKIVGISVHTMAQLEEAVALGADYVGIGAMFPTASKADAIPASLTFLQEARQRYPDFPIVAIGGITTTNSQLVRHAGANGVAVISEITNSPAISKTVAAL